MAASIDLLLPVGADPYAAAERDLVRTAVRDRLAAGLWVRDLPSVPAGDPDVGQGGDPFAHLGVLVGAGLDRGLGPSGTLGTASIILGVRHPLVVARAVAGLQAQARCRVALGVGTGGKPAMNEALGISGRPMREFARQWRELRAALHRPADDAATAFVAPAGYRAPDMLLATTDLGRWEAIEGQAEGWQTFLSTPEAYLRALDAVRAIRVGPLQVCVRADVDLAGDAPAPHIGERGRVRCTRRQLVALVRTWAQLPVDHLLLSVRGADPLAALREVHAAL